MDSLIRRTVEFSRRHAGVLAVVILIAALGAAAYVAHGIGIDSDTGKLVDPNLPWQRAAADLDRQFPQNKDLLVVVVDAATPDQSSDAAAELARRMGQRPDLYEYVRQPDANQRGQPTFRMKIFLKVRQERLQLLGWGGNEYGVAWACPANPVLTAANFAWLLIGATDSAHQTTMSLIQ